MKLGEGALGRGGRGRPPRAREARALPVDFCFLLSQFLFFLNGVNGDNGGLGLPSELWFDWRDVTRQTQTHKQKAEIRKQKFPDF